MIMQKSLKDGQWQKNEGSKPDYKEGRAGIKGHENRTIQNTKPDSSVFLSQASTSAAGSSCRK
jgi:hypothetical protein